MHIATVKPHPTDPSFVIVGVASVLNPTMGRFEPARLSAEHKGYLVHADNIDALIRFLRLENIAVSDSRPTAASNGPPQFHRKPSIVLKCANCDYTQRDRGTCNRCGAAALGDHIVTVEEQIDINRRGMAKVKAAAAGQPWENLP